MCKVLKVRINVKGNIFTELFPSTSATINKTVKTSTVCIYCGRDCHRLSDLKLHLRVHTGERPYKCDLCPATFARAATLTIHRRRHTGEKPYRCTMCGMNFVTRHIYRTHILRHHMRSSLRHHGPSILATAALTSQHQGESVLIKPMLSVQHHCDGVQNTPSTNDVFVKTEHEGMFRV